jgi:MFS transporter, DHA3 family, macrolide efflux protein
VRLPRVIQPLRHRDFRLLWVGQTLTFIGSFVSNVAFPFQLLQLGGSALELGTLISIFTAANLVFLLVGGAVADRVPRRTLLIATEIASGTVMAIVASLGLTGSLQIWHLYVSMIVFGISSAFSGPAIGALIPELVPEDILVSGNALRGLSRQAARSVGPVLGGLLVAFAGPPIAFAVDAVSFFVSAGAVALTVARPIARAERTSILADIREGLAFVFSVQWLWVTIFGWSFINAAFLGAYVVGLPLFVTETLREGAVVYGVITASVGIGEALGAALISQIRIRRVGLVMFLFGTMSGVGLLVYGLIPTFPGAIAGGAIIGFSFVCFGVLWESALQRLVPRRLLGRVTSVDWFGGTLLAPIAPLIAAALVITVTPPGLFLIAGAITIALTLLGLLLPSIRDLE